MSKIIKKLIKQLHDIQSKPENYENSIEEIKILNKLSYHYYSSDPDKTDYYADKAIKKAKKIGYRKGVGRTYLIKGIVNWQMSNYKKALFYYKKALNVFTDINFRLGIGNAYNNMGLLYLKSGNFNDAIDNFQKSLKIYKNDKEKASVYVHMGMIYIKMQKNETALNYYYKALKWFKQSNNKKFQANCYNNIGNIFKNEKRLDKAKEYYLKALELWKSINDKGLISYSYLNLGSIYSDYNDFTRALSYYQKSLKISADLKDKTAMAETYQAIAEVYSKDLNFDLALENLLKGLEITKKNNLRDMRMSIYEKIANVYSFKEDFENSYHYCLKYNELKDEVYNKELNNKIAELQAQFDIETQKKEAEIYRLKNIELKKANAAKDKFFSIVAHDLKSPFSTIISFVNIMKKAFGNYDKAQIMELVDELEKSTQNTFNLLKNLLEWSRMQSGVIDYSPREFNINKKIKEVTALKKQEIEQKDITLKLELTPDLSAYGDMNMITTVIRNLINNAIKFTKPGGKVKVKSKQKNQDILVEVEDTGIGISEENISKLFKIESNFSTQGTANERGTGLGLILVKEFVEKNGGIIKVESEKGKGSIFSFSLPLKKQQNKKVEE